MHAVPTAVVDGDVELLVSRSLLVFYMATSALRPLLTEGRVGVDWESRIGAWYLPFTACAYCAMSFAEDVRPPLPVRPACRRSHLRFQRWHLLAIPRSACCTTDSCFASHAVESVGRITATMVCHL